MQLENKGYSGAKVIVNDNEVWKEINEVEEQKYRKVMENECLNKNVVAKVLRITGDDKKYAVMTKYTGDLEDYFNQVQHKNNHADLKEKLINVLRLAISYKTFICLEDVSQRNVVLNWKQDGSVTEVRLIDVYDTVMPKVSAFDSDSEEEEETAENILPLL